MNIDAIVGYGLAKARKKHGLTQKDLAGKAGVARTVLVKIEVGDRPLRVSELIQFCNALNIDALELIPSELLDVDPSRRIRSQYRQEISELVSKILPE